VAAFRVVPDAELSRRLGEELADVLLYLVRLADVAGVGLTAEAVAKLAANDERFPVAAVRSGAPKRS